MRIAATLLALLALAPLPAPAQEHTHPPQTGSLVAPQEVYICPMHPHITGHKGDNCPICGMALVPRPAEFSAPGEDGVGASPDRAAVSLGPDFVQALGVRTQAVARRVFGEKVHAFGRLAAQERREYPVAVRSAGLVRALGIDSVGQRVRKGDVLFTLYSRDLVVAQQDYLARPQAGAHRLRMLGMDDPAIDGLMRGRSVLYEVPFHAPVDGVVSSLAVRQGQSVAEGDIPVTIHDLSVLWVEASVPSRDLVSLRVGSVASVRTEPGQPERTAHVAILGSEIDEQTRTGLVRAALDNADGILRPGGYADIVFESGSASRLSVPSAAVLRGAQGARVIQDLGGGRFRSVPVETGVRTHAFTEILSGVEEGARVVVDGQFLIDAESTLRGGTARMEDSPSPAAPRPVSGQSEGVRHEH